MSNNLEIVTRPDRKIITTVEAKAHLRVDLNDDDPLINTLISAAQSYCERYTRRIFVETEFNMYLDCFPKSRWFWLPRSPLLDVASVVITYLDINGATQTFATSNYSADIGSERPARVYLLEDKDWPTTQSNSFNVGIINFKAGTRGSTNSKCIPDEVKAAALLIVGNLYENRESVTAMQLYEAPQSVKMILDSFSIVESYVEDS